MGVSGLLGSISPYAKEEKWPPNRDSEETTALVIDGPAFAYYIYHRCLSQMHTAGHAIDAVPTYDFVLQTAQLWLDCVGRCGLAIKQVFFDGALPPYKYQVRRERLQKSIDQMRAYKLLNPDLPSAFRSRAQAGPVFLSSADALSGEGRHVPADFKSIPAATFLVPALLEYLLASEYRASVQVVPCEADLMCTSAHICTESDVILTSDSDLVLQNPRGRLVFFNSLRFADPGTDGLFRTLYADIYQSRQIADRLQIEEELFVLSGYHMTQDTHAGLIECSKRAKQGLLANDQEYLAFRAQYHPWATVPSWLDVFSCKDDHAPSEDYVRSDAAERAGSMDPRILEFVVATRSASTGGSVYHMFLPALLDDPSRSSAWASSARIRQVAYNLWMQGAITAANKNRLRICEADRRGTRLAQTMYEIEDLTTAGSHTGGSAEGLGQELLRLTAIFKDNDIKHMWARVVLLLFFWSEKETSGPDKLPARHEVARLVAQTSKADQKSMTWSLVHLIAQLDAWYYSLRMLKQVSGLVTSLRPPNTAVDRLCSLVDHLPGIADILASPAQGFDFGVSDTANDRFYQELGRIYPAFDAERDARASTKKIKASKKKRKASQEQTKSQAGVKAPRNMYDLLSDET